MDPCSHGGPLAPAIRPTKGLPAPNPCDLGHEPRLPGAPMESQFTCSECGCSKCLEPSTNPAVPVGSTDGDGPSGTVTMSASMRARRSEEHTAGGPATMRFT